MELKWLKFVREWNERYDVYILDRVGQLRERGVSLDGKVGERDVNI
jgi:hypothetical protein